MTVDNAFHPGLCHVCHEGIENATVTRIALLSGPLPVALDPRMEYDNNDVDADDDAYDDDDDDGDDEDDDDDDDYDYDDEDDDADDDGG